MTNQRKVFTGKLLLGGYTNPLYTNVEERETATLYFKKSKVWSKVSMEKAENGKVLVTFFLRTKNRKDLPYQKEVMVKPNAKLTYGVIAPDDRTSDIDFFISDAAGNCLLTINDRESVRDNADVLRTIGNLAA